MKNIDGLLKRRDAIQKKIDAVEAEEKRKAEQAVEKRKVEIAKLAQKAGLLDMTDAQLKSEFSQIAQRAGVKKAPAPGAGEQS
jgi:hypothetical protein